MKSRIFALALAVQLLIAGCAYGPEVRLGSLACAVDPAGTTACREAPDRGLLLTFFTTGIGDATLIQFPSGRTLLVDAGIGWRTDQILAYLEEQGIQRLDGLLLTHPHVDHYGGMREIVGKVPVGAFFESGASQRHRPYRLLMEALDERSVARRLVSRGTRLDDLTGPDASIEVLYPDQQALALNGNKNHASIVFSLTHGSRRFLFTGDAEMTEEERLLALDGPRLAHDLLKLGHHASPDSGREDFLRAVRPRLAVAMGCGIVNIPPFYARPNFRIRRVLREQRTAVFTTHLDGVVQVLSNGEKLWVRAGGGPWQQVDNVGGSATAAPVKLSLGERPCSAVSS